ncbi:MAG: UDP-glycosyltransferase [Christiangramia sp.]|uniref:UDP-glycosyltransferase n=1 Tax=Christiangramia sp. TaxID=1931228 RepID=UPI0032420C7C
MKKKKIFILLPDGVGLRNFAFTSFVAIGKKLGWEVIFWNNTPFDLKKLNYKEIKLNGKPRAKTDLIKRAKINMELDHFTKKFNDPVYQDYKFPPSRKGLKNKVKNVLVSVYCRLFNGAEGLKKIRSKLQDSERKGKYYTSCIEILKTEKPDYIFCTNQRSLNAIAPLTAARDLGIPNGSFIFSWDNLPKATLIVEPDTYFVWSENMKRELLDYYPHIDRSQIAVTGTPQFEPHFEEKFLKPKEVFYKENNLDKEKEYLCFSGDDITTSPDDPQYLQDVAESVESLNKQGYNLGIIFRRCPVDFSDRYDMVLKKYKNLIIPLEPKWKKMGEDWNKILPTEDDQELLINTIFHTSAVINVGSSMVFDFALFGKPCLFINYDVPDQQRENWSTSKIYKFVHFRTMPAKDAVIFLNSKEEVAEKILQALHTPERFAEKAKKWFYIINKESAEHASERIWKKINAVYKKEMSPTYH